MKWYIIPSLMTCGLNCTLAIVVLSLAVFHLYTDKSTNAPIPPNDEWIGRTKGLIPFSMLWAGVSLLGIFISMARNRIWLATTTLSLHVICFGLAVYFACAFGAQLEGELEDVPVETLVNLTKIQIDKNKKTPNWIPGWLDNIQKQSKQCCGINTYRDYEQFWPESHTRIPRSCCRDEKVLPSPCPNDLTNIPFPHTPAIFYKVETGCMDEINESIRNHIEETLQNCIIMSIFTGIGVMAFLLVFVKRYLATSSGKEGKTKIIELASRCEACTGDSSIGDAPMQIRNDAQYPASPPGIDSFDGTGSYPYMVSSIDSISAVAPQGTVAEPEPAPPQKEVKDTSQYITSGSIGTHSASSGSSPYIPPIPKTNAVFAGLQKKPEVGTGGDDMTIGASSMGRREVFVTQDNPLDTPAGRNIIQSTTSGDDIGDVVHDDDANRSPPGSPGGKRKKVRKAGMAHHHHKNHHQHKEP